ncbi:MAG TPA: DAK2 domain-containing protein [Dehalococcoidia bacterium]|nr:DAK2 domain-containing protein [Dehalococcoidia bacterium]
MKQADTIGGQDLREMLAAATNWLEKSSADIDALNVFPVPDGDTGTNMLLTMRSSIEEAFRAPDNSACTVAEAVALGALMGARGNSGVILSQIWRGLAKGLEDKESCTGGDLAAALESASEMAYKGLSNPVEGTILTVIKDVSEAAQAEVADGEKDFVSVMEAMVSAAARSVANTPNLLSVLKEAGVVDAGGQGLYTILDGALRYLKGEAEQMKYRKPQLVVADIAATRMPQMVAADEVPYGYCTEFLLKGEELAPDKIRTRLKNRGESLIVVGDESAVRIHIHTLDPGNVLRYATALGTVHQVSIRNMDEQHEAYLEMQKERMPLVDVATIAVVSGEGLAEVFKSLGTTAIVAGGQTMNPSTKDLLRVVESVTSDNVIILPNNKNIVATANQVESVTPKKIVVVPSETIPQGVSALLAFDYEADFETNAKLMARAISTVRSIEITRAVRSAKLGDLTIKRKQAIGFLDGELVNVGTTPADALSKVLAGLDLDMAEVITIYFGADSELAEAQEVSNKICQKHSHLQVEVVRGGQPHYNYIVSVE